MYDQFFIPANEYVRPVYRAPQPDEALIEAVSLGDADAMARLYEQTGAAVYGFALSILKNPHSAQDVMQDTYLRILSYAKDYQSHGKPMAWILTITRNLALSQLKKQENRTDPLEEGLSAFPSVDDDTDRSLNRLVLNTALQQLSQQERQIVMLYNTVGFKHREIADFLGLPLSTVLSKYRRALAKLQKTLSEEL